MWPNATGSRCNAINVSPKSSTKTPHNPPIREYEVPCVSKVPSSSLHQEALGAWLRCVLKHRQAVVSLCLKRGHLTPRHAIPSATWKQFWNIRRYLKSITWPTASNLLQCHHCVRYEEPRPGSPATSSRRLLKHTACSVCFKTCIWALRRQYTFIKYISHEALWASSLGRLNKRHAASRCLFQNVHDALRHKYTSIQPISP